MTDERAERAILSHAEAYRLVTECQEQRARADRLAVALAELRAALHRYGVHERYVCELQEICECGLDEARALGVLEEPQP
jgi:hypothetical protein